MSLVAQSLSVNKKASLGLYSSMALLNNVFFPIPKKLDVVSHPDIA